MSVDELISQLEDELKEKEKYLMICCDNYNDCHKDIRNGSVAYHYALYEKAFGDFERLRSAIDVVKERIERRHLWVKE